MADEAQENSPVEGQPPVGEGAGRPMLREEEKLRRLERTVAGNISVTHIIWDALQHAKTAPSDTSGDGWTPLGPRNVGGAVRALAQDPVQHDTFYAGAAEGGLWRTRDQGNTWEPLGETELGVVPVGSIAVAPSDRRFIYVGTGEKTAGKVGGVGLFRSRDAGATFERIADGDEFQATPNPGAAYRYTRIVVDPRDPNRFWAASSTGLWRFEGTSPHLEAIGIPAQLITDVALAQAPADANKLWLLAAAHGVGVFRGVFTRSSTTTVWAASAGFPPTRPNSAPASPNPVGRIRVAFAPSNADFAYALAEDVTSPYFTYNPRYPLPLLQSTNGGRSFAYVPVAGTVNWMETPPPVPPPAVPPPPVQPAPPNPGQGYYSMDLVVHPTNPATVVAGHVDLHRTTNGGGSWTRLIDWNQYMNHDLRAQHADMHALLFDLSEGAAAAPRRIWCGNDGGVSFTEDQGVTWRKRSYGIIGAQFIDITTHRVHPFIFGGGMQDNGTFITYGGPTWYRAGSGDGGAMAFHPTDPRQLFVTNQKRPFTATVGLTRLGGNDSRTPLREVAVTGAVGAIDDHQVRTSQIDVGIPTTFEQTFRGLLRADPVTPGRLLLGRTGGGAFFSPDNGANWTQLGLPGPALVYTVPTAGGGLAETSALAFAHGAAAATDYYVGTTTGDVFATPNNGGAFNHTTPFNSPGVQAFISSIAVHPAHPEVVAVAAYAADNRKVMLSHNRGLNWVDISGGNQLPPGGVASLAFHPTDPRVLFAGTLVGVWVTRRLPAYAGAPLPAAPAIDPRWRSFNRGLAPMLVNDLEVVELTSTLRCATFARGCFEASIRGVQGDGDPGPYATPEEFRVPPVRLSIRDHAMDDSRSYPLANRTADDPRLPAGHNADHLGGRQSIDIKVNAPEFEDRVRRFLQSERYGNLPDGSELDEEFISEEPITGDTNRIYIQVHNRGHEPASNVQVFLYWADAGNNPATPPFLDPAAIAFPGEPQAGSAWQRAGVQTVGTLRPGHPAVVRFDWILPLTVRHNVALLAVCHSAQDPLDFAPQANADVFVGLERKAAMRVTPVRHDAVFIRDGLDDFGRRGSVAWGGRTPDILVLRRAAADAIPPADLNSPTGPLGNLMDARSGDRIVPGNDNAIFVRVHNRHDVPVHVDVELYQAPASHPTTGPWTAIGSLQRALNVQPGTWQVVRFDLTAADPAPTNAAAWAKAFVLGATCRGVDAASGTELDPMPPLPTLTGVDAFWSFFTRGPLATNAALRALRFEAAP